MRKNIQGPVRQKKGKYSGILLFAVLSFLFFSTSCSKLFEMAFAFIEKQNKEILSSSGKVSVKVPGSWMEMSDLNEVADLQAGSVKDDVYLIIISESKEDFEKMTLKRYSKITSDPIYEGLINPSRTGTSDIKVGLYDAIQVQMKGTIDNTNLEYLHVTVETPKNYHQILFWSTVSGFKDYEKQFEKIIQSFKETEAK